MTEYPLACSGCGLEHVFTFMLFSERKRLEKFLWEYMSVTHRYLTRRSVTFSQTFIFFPLDAAICYSVRTVFRCKG